MPAELVTRSVRMPRRARYLVPRGLPRRGELLAACAVVIIGVHVLFAQLTLVIAVACYLTGKATRWRTSWLLVPAAGGMGVMLLVGPGGGWAGVRAAGVRSMRAGRVVTRDGCCVGVAPASGSRVTVSWPELEGGALICGSAGPDLRNASLRVVQAALRRRKPVLAVDFTGDPGMPGQLTAACAAAGVPLQVLDLNSGASYYEPFRSGDPADRVP